jgi:U4/U6 small nuclear ribonucleoprotein PRP3
MAALKARVAAAIGTSKAKGGLNVGLHPALEDLGSWKPASKSKDSTPSSSSARSDKARGQDGFKAGSLSKEGGENPYYDPGLASQSGGGKARQSRSLVFNQKGKYIAQANALRRQAALEAMKKRIAEQTRKAGIDEDLDVERNFVTEAPSGAEWWDEGLVAGTNYDLVDDPSQLKLNTPDSIITEYIQHPVALEPPQDRHVPAAKPMFLTSREQAKLRRQRRMAELKEMQAKIRLGLVPAPPPKVKKGNLMRVLGDGKLNPYIATLWPLFSYLHVYSCCQRSNGRRSTSEPRDCRAPPTACRNQRREETHQRTKARKVGYKPAEGC